MVVEAQARGRVHVLTQTTANAEIASTLPPETWNCVASWKGPVHTTDDVDMEPRETEEGPLRKKSKLSDKNLASRPQLHGWFTMHDLKELLKSDEDAKRLASNAPYCLKGQGHGNPCIAIFLITDGQDAWELYRKHFYVPPPPGYPGR